VQVVLVFEFLSPRIGEGFFVRPVHSWNWVDRWLECRGLTPDFSCSDGGRW
jgi:hypothetical protein